MPSLYQSDITVFLNSIKEKDSMLEKEQKRNFDTWWNKLQDFDVAKKNSMSECHQNSYYYIQKDISRMRGDESS
ncbi:MULTISPECIES: DUF3460 family protein [Candidatus Ichthyocystis]|uniref:DUF3460 family protein n=1 Tax=Candidatus Ichthyocystis TaxID=2929841 RepID=UPI000B84164E|nr:MULTISPECIES: DUF3460 family protein [Ichthyocystis]